MASFRMPRTAVHDITECLVSTTASRCVRTPNDYPRSCYCHFEAHWLHICFTPCRHDAYAPHYDATNVKGAASIIKHISLLRNVAGCEASNLTVTISIFQHNASIAAQKNSAGGRRDSIHVGPISDVSHAIVSASPESQYTRYR